MPRRSPRSPRSGLARIAAGCLLSTALLLGGCGGGGTANERVPDGTPVILISVDTLRSDRLPAYGYTGVETPALDAFRKQAILFEHAYTPVPITLPSHTSMLTGELPATHGVRDNAGYRLDGASFPSLPETLREHGYKTGAAVSAFVLRSSTGIGYGFDMYEDKIGQTSWAQLGSAQRRGDETLRRSLDWLRSVHEQPFFFFLHLYEPHRPHDPPEPYKSRYVSGYDGEVAFADSIIGDLFDELRKLGVYDKAVILFVSDHGEGLGDHGFEEHGPLLYREQIQVPMMLKLPNGDHGGETVTEAADLVDILPTVFGLLGLETPENLPGRSLLSLQGSAERQLVGETLFPRIHFGWSELASVIEYPYHYIYGPDPELYDLSKDPGETVNLLPDQKRVADRLRSAIRDYDLTFKPPGEEDPEVRKKLAALGYLSGGATEHEGPLPDPKTKLGVLRLLGNAFADFKANRFDKAATEYRDLLKEEPGLAEAWEYLGHSLLRLGRPEEALDAYQHQMAIAGGPQVSVSAAEALFRMGRLAEAEQHAKVALDTYPLNAGDLLARIALQRNDLDEAERYVKIAVANRGKMPGPLLTEAELRLDQGRYDDVLRLTQTVEDEVGEGVSRDLIKGLYFLRGRALAEQNHPHEAIAAFSREIELFPDTLPAYSHLALLYAIQGDSARSGATLQHMVQVNDTPAAYAEAVRAIRLLGDPATAARLLQHARGRWPKARELAELGS